MTLTQWPMLHSNSALDRISRAAPIYLRRRSGYGLNAPANSPAPVSTGTPVVPPAITSLDGPGSAGLGFAQNYTVTMIKDGRRMRLGVT